MAQAAARLSLSAPHPTDLTCRRSQGQKVTQELLKMLPDQNRSEGAGGPVQRPGRRGLDTAHLSLSHRNGRSGVGGGGHSRSLGNSPG